MEDDAVISDYQSRSSDCHRLLNELRHQIEHLISKSGATLGVPLEGRVKDLSSILDKEKRKARKIRSVKDFDDLIGLRIIVLFQRELSILDKLLREKFRVVNISDTSSRLDSSQFGYQSLHYVLSIKSEWSELPSFTGLTEYVFEVQLRTLAQHIWAVASHKLQYKREESVPQPLKRSINRVSALLEIVDIEFDRVLEKRDEYTSEGAEKDSTLNVDLLEKSLDKLLPSKNKDERYEPYDELLSELNHFKISTHEQLKKLVDETKEKVLREEARRAAEDPEEADYYSQGPELNRVILRHQQGVFFTHAGLLRTALDEKFGQDERLSFQKQMRYGQKIDLSTQKSRKKQRDQHS